MDVVEGVGGECPGVFGCVVDLEFQVGGDPAWLGGGEVCADYEGFWVLVGEVDGPDSWQKVLLIFMDLRVGMWKGIRGWVFGLSILGAEEISRHTRACSDIKYFL